MRLKEDEIKKIDAALKLLGESLKDELQNLPNAHLDELDDPFLKKIATHYLSAKGVMMLVADARLQSKEQAKCLCGCSCVQPEKGLITL
jgi:hypothetical protein